MNDTLSVKKLLSATITNTQLDVANVRTFARVTATKTENRRRSAHIHSLSPTDLVVSHIPRTIKNDTQRTLFALDQTLTRFDASTNPIKSTGFRAAVQFNINSDITLAEFREGVYLLLGSLTESDGALITALYNGEF